MSGNSAETCHVTSLLLTCEICDHLFHYTLKGIRYAASNASCLFVAYYLIRSWPWSNGIPELTGIFGRWVIEVVVQISKSFSVDMTGCPTR